MILFIKKFLLYLLLRSVFHLKVHSIFWIVWNKEIVSCITKHRIWRHTVPSLMGYETPYKETMGWTNEMFVFIITKATTIIMSINTTLIMPIAIMKLMITCTFCYKNIECFVLCQQLYIKYADGRNCQMPFRNHFLFTLYKALNKSDLQVGQLRRHSIRNYMVMWRASDGQHSASLRLTWPSNRGWEEKKK